MTISDIIVARKRIWEDYHDIERDRELCEAAGIKIVETPELVAEIKAKPYLLIEAVMTIVDKKGALVPFFLNCVQKDIQANIDKVITGGSIYVLKGRQQGVTSYISAVQLSFAIVWTHWRGMTIADCEANTLAIFKDKGKDLLGRIPSVFMPTISEDNAQTLAFGKLDNAWRVATATPKVGRSKTLRFAHLSEIAFYSVPLADIQAAIGQSMTPNAIIIYETTANGYNEAKKLWDGGSCINLFYEWWLSEEYNSEDTSIINEIKDGWLINKIEWLRKKGINDNQIAWYCGKYNQLLERAKLMQEYPCTADEAFIASGDCYFDLEKLVLRRSDCPGPIKIGDFVVTEWTEGYEKHPYKWEFVERKNGGIKIYCEPELNKPYVIGGDTADTGSDRNTAQVIDNTTGQQVAVLRGHYDEDLYAEQIYCLGMYYNGALVAIETNFSTHPTKELQRMCYPRQYIRQTEDQISHKLVDRYGVKTTALSRPIMLATLQEIVREYVGLINDAETISEMIVFVRNNAGRYEAQQGEKDDLVMGLAIAYYSRGQQRFEVLDTPKEVVVKPGRQHLLREYGIKL